MMTIYTGWSWSGARRCVLTAVECALLSSCALAASAMSRRRIQRGRALSLSRERWVWCVFVLVCLSDV